MRLAVKREAMGALSRVGFQENVAGFWLHKMNTFTREAGDRLVSVMIGLDRFVLCVALNAETSVGAVIEDCSHSPETHSNLHKLRHLLILIMSPDGQS